MRPQQKLSRALFLVRFHLTPGAFIGRMTMSLSANRRHSAGSGGSVRAQLAVQLRRLRCHSGETIDRHGLADALEFRLALGHRVWRNNFRYSWRAVNFFGDANLVAIGEILYPRCDIHRLAKIIEP